MKTALHIKPEHSKPKSYHIHSLPLCIIISEIGVVPCPLYTINSALRQGVKGKGKGTTGAG